MFYTSLLSTASTAAAETVARPRVSPTKTLKPASIAIAGARRVTWQQSAMASTYKTD